MEKKREIRASLITTAGTLLVWSIQQLAKSNSVEGIIAFGFALILFWLYEHVCWLQERKLLDEIETVMSAIDNDQIEDVIENGSDELMDALERFD